MKKERFCFDISIVKENKTLSFILLFDNIRFCNEFLNILQRNPFSFHINKSEKGTYNFCVSFNNTEYELKYNSLHTESKYPPLNWIKEDIQSFLYCGVIGEDGKHNRRKESFLIEKLIIS